MTYSNQIPPSSASIGSSSIQTAKPVTKPEAAPASAATPSRSSATNQTDQASLSSASTLIAAALQAPDVRADKVASLQQAIASGSYSVSSSAVADKLLQSLLR